MFLYFYIAKSRSNNIGSEVQCWYVKQKSAHPFTWSPNSRSARARANAMKESFNWAHQTMDLLSHLRDVLGGICREWETFTKEDDIDFFSDLDEDPYTPGVVSACQSLRNIKETFVMLEKHRQTLISLNDLLNQFSRTVRLILFICVSIFGDTIRWRCDLVEIAPVSGSQWYGGAQRIYNGFFPLGTL